MKVCVVTGGSQGIGAQTVIKFAQSGYSVILNYNKSEYEAKQLQQKLVGLGCDVHLYQADVSNESQVQGMFNWVQKYFKHVDCLVNNAGVWRGGVIDDSTLSDYNYVMDTNAKGTFLCCKYCLPLLKNTSDAHVVNVSSIWGLMGSSCESIYCMSKYAVVGLTSALSQEWQPLGIDVSCVCPPIVRTNMCSCYSQQDIDNFCKQHGTNAYEPSEVAQQIFALATTVSNGKIVKM